MPPPTNQPQPWVLAFTVSVLPGMVVVTPSTVLVKLQHTYPYDGEEALAAIRDSGGSVCVATDEEAFAAQQRIGATDGIFAEPSSTVVLTAIEDLVATGRIEPGQSVVGVLTGSGHRETHVLIERREAAVETITTADGEARLARFLGEPRPVGEVVA